MAPKYPQSPFLVPRRSSSYGGGSDLDTTSPVSATSPPSQAENSATDDIKVVEPEHKSTLIGCTANLITAIVGAGELLCSHLV